MGWSVYGRWERGWEERLAKGSGVGGCSGQWKRKTQALGHFYPGLTIVGQLWEVVPPAGDDRTHPDPCP